MNDLQTNTEPIILCKSGTTRTDINVGGLHVHDFTTMFKQATGMTPAAWRRSVA